MSSPIITVENLGKCYRLQHQSRERYTALRDVITNRVKSLFGPPTSDLRPPTSEEDFWALKDVSFEIKQGEVVGIIGRNGAGKSTLLKILSRITEPTKGRVTLRGRVASLLEVGTGFHPELTGRENIFLNGAILGMARAEIRAKFDEIVAFAEVEKFLDTPVKRYSSGMYVRLAFAVAAHLEPEILVVDEVLAVGDAEFQKKCLGKMQAVSRTGRTVLFVSHNTGMIKSLCGLAILLEAGNIKVTGQPDEVVDQYLAHLAPEAQFRHSSTSEAYVVGCVLLNSKGKPAGVVFTNEPLRVAIQYRNRRSIKGVRLGFNICSADGTIIATCSPEDEGSTTCTGEGLHEAVAQLGPNLLLRGAYQINVGLWNRADGSVIDEVKGIIHFTAEAAKERAYRVDNHRPGLIQLPVIWTVRSI